MSLTLAIGRHGPQLYSGWGYGTIYTTNVLALEVYASGTQWAMPTDLWDVFAHLVLDGQAPATRGANYDFLACGRLFTYFRHDDAFGVNQGHYHCEFTDVDRFNNVNAIRNTPAFVPFL